MCSHHGFQVLKDTFVHHLKINESESLHTYPDTKQEYEDLMSNAKMKEVVQKKEEHILDTKIFELHKTMSMNEVPE